jgi:hypothetical protein
MKIKMIISTLSAAVFIFVFGSLSWAGNYRSEHHYYYYGDKHLRSFDHKPPRHYQKNHHKPPVPRSYSRARDFHRPPRQDIHIHKHMHVYPPPPIYNKRPPGYPARYRPYRPSYCESGFYFGTSIYEPGLTMGFSIMGR